MATRNTKAAKPAAKTARKPMPVGVTVRDPNARAQKFAAAKRASPKTARLAAAAGKPVDAVRAALEAMKTGQNIDTAPAGVLLSPGPSPDTVSKLRAVALEVASGVSPHTGGIVGMMTIADVLLQYILTGQKPAPALPAPAPTTSAN